MEEISQREFSVEESKAALMFAQGLYDGMNGYMYNTGFYNPFTQNQNLINLNGQSIVPEYDRLKQALGKAVESAVELQGFSEYMAVWDTIYKKTLDLYDNILSFDLSYCCVNVKDPKEYASDEYKADLRRLHKFLDRFDYKREFKKAIYHMNRRDFYPCWFRDSFGTINDEPLDEGDNTVDIRKLPKYALQMMPQDYCLITGYSPETILWDFNMAYFLNPTVDISLFDPSFRRKFESVYDSSGDWKYNPASQFDRRDGKYANYIQMSPDDGMWTFKFNEATFDTIPPFANLMKAVFNNTKIQDLQLDKDFISAMAILYGELRLLKNGQSGEKPDEFAISPRAVGNFMDLIKNALSRNFKEIAVPLENSNIFQFEDKVPDMVGTALENSAGQGAFSSSIVYSTGKKGQAEFLNGLITDYNIMKKLYSQFNAFMNFFLNKKTKKYKFSFSFDGCSYPFEREYRRKQMIELSDRGLTLPSQAWASVYGYEPQHFQRMLEESKYGGLSDNLMLLLNANTSKNGGEVGNPQKDVTDLKDSGSVSREYR